MFGTSQIMCFNETNDEILLICYTSTHRHAALTCVPWIVAGGPGQGISEAVDEVEEGPGQDDGVESGVQLNHQ